MKTMSKTEKIWLEINTHNKKKDKKFRGVFGEAWQQLKKNKMAMAALVVLAAIVFLCTFAPLFTKYSYSTPDLNVAYKTPNAEHLLGTDNFGRDLFTRVLYGGRLSLIIAALVVVISSGIGCAVGLLAGYFKTFDLLMMRVVDVLAAIPTLVLAISLSATLGTGTQTIVIALGIAYAPSCIRIVRASVLGVRNKEFIEAATSCGAHHGRILFRHILPNSLSPIIVQSTLNIARALIYSSTLSFLGLGVQPPSPEWGAMLSAYRSYMQQYPYLVIAPGLAIFITSLALNHFGDGLRDALDPRLKN